MFWNCPKLNQVKLHIDGNLSEDMRDGGGIPRDSIGKMIWSFGFRSHHKFIKSIELIALVKGFEYYRFCNDKSVLIKSNLLVISRWLSSNMVTWDI